MKKKSDEVMRTSLFFLLLFSFSSTAKADLIGTILSVGSILYGVAAGLAALMIVLHAIRWKTAGSAQDRDDAKRGLVNVVLGLALITIAASVVSTVFIKPEGVGFVNNTVTTLSLTSTSAGGSTSSTSAASTSSTSSSITYVTTTTSPPISNGECYNAENGNLCTGLDFVYGAGTRTICCNSYGCCCNPLTPGACSP